MENNNLVNNTTNVDKAVDMLFENRKNYIIIGLTGRTGSGCSTVADLLSRKNFEELQYLPKPGGIGQDTNEGRKEEIVYNYMKENWEQFHIIRMHNIITSFILENSWDVFVELVNIDKDKKEYEKFKAMYSKWNQEVCKYNEDLKDIKIKVTTLEQCETICKMYIEDMEAYTKEIKRFVNEYSKIKYATLYQKIANNIRKSGKITDENFNPSKVFELSRRTNQIIKLIGMKNELKKGNVHSKKVLVVIDAFRNPYEATFFKDRYSSFYLFSINVENSERERRLLKEGALTTTDISAIDDIEYPQKKPKNLEEIFYHQHIEKCVELSDLYIYNPKDECVFRELKKQIVKYLSLIMHPGIVTPNHIERCMQIAYNAKVNSGCISRQVGALVTDNEYAIKSIGWNDVPQGQTPCNLRSLCKLYAREDAIAYSEYELSDIKFTNHISKIQENIEEITQSQNNTKRYTKSKGRPIAYCFKDIYNGMKQEKNQVHTRSLHAEENAFLQIAKNGGMAIRNGYLFTTASPCELCAKKAYQLGIKKIFYIDLYPGISEKHILNNGKNKPELVLFHGAIGRAYTQFYTPIISYKDELYMLMGKDIADKVADIKNTKEKVYKIKMSKEQINRVRKYGVSTKNNK